MKSLEQFLAQIDRPLGYAAKVSGAGRARVRLGRYVTDQLTNLSGVPSPQARQLLRRLMRLFQDYDGLAEAARPERLSAAQSILAQLRDLPAGPGDGARPARPEDGAALAQSIDHLPGVGSRRAAQLRTLGASTVEELLTMLPWRYEDRSQLCPVSRLEPDQFHTVMVEVKAVGGGRTRRRWLAIVELVGADDTGLLSAKWFGQPYLQQYFKIGQRVMLTGRARPNSYGGPRFQMENPHYELIDRSGDALLHSGRIVPVYHETRGLGSRAIRTIMRRAIDMYGDVWPEVLPEWARRAHQLMAPSQAIEEVHFPPPGVSSASLQNGQSPAHRRLIFEEFVLLALGLGCRKREVKQRRLEARFSKEGPLQARFLAALGFSLTTAQRRVIAEIERDLSRPEPMNRMVQGDVGCGKTVVAVCAMVMACDAGRQAAMMAPTEILAEQHAATLRRWLEPIGIDVVLLTSGMRAKARREALARLGDGSAGVVVGTQALIMSGVDYHRLGLIVIDEQHRFGVLQRAELAHKGRDPDVLVMTATPIPRTLALTVYGDLDLSVIDELPPGRTPVATQLVDASRRVEADRLLRRELAAGRQAYVVYPLVDVSEKIDLKAATQMAAALGRQFPQTRVGLLHGRMKPALKERTMREFASGAIGILVATTVIEVGIDVPNATVMMIEHPERFGLAQLHQLRGRVGRGTQPSHCLLMADRAGGEEARRRLEAVVRSQDGFAIAEADLAIRGPGEFFGTRQSGLPELRVAHLLRDAKVLEEARACAQRILEEDPTLARPDHQALRSAMGRRWAGRLSLMTIS